MEFLYTISKEEENLVLKPVSIDQIIEKAIERYLERNTPINTLEEKEKPVKIEDIASLLKVTRQTVSDYKRRGLIPFEKVGGRIFFYESKVLESLKKFKVSK